METDLSKPKVTRAVRQFIRRVGNAMPIIVSCAMYDSVAPVDMFTWIRYNAVIVPFFLLAFNFALDCTAFSAVKLFIIILVEAACVLIHLLYFEFSLTPAQTTAVTAMVGIAAAILIVGGIVLCLLSLRWRKQPIDWERIAKRTPLDDEEIISLPLEEVESIALPEGELVTELADKYGILDSSSIPLTVVGADTDPDLAEGFDG